MLLHICAVKNCCSKLKIAKPQLRDESMFSGTKKELDHWDLKGIQAIGTSYTIDVFVDIFVDVFGIEREQFTKLTY